MNKTISIDDDVVKDIELLSEKENRSFSNMVSIILKEYLANMKPKGD